jgi:hypothetical protein
MTEELILKGTRILFEQSLKRAGCTDDEIKFAWPMISKPTLEFFTNCAEMVLALVEHPTNDTPHSHD